VVVWGQQAERTAENLRKGNKVYIEGRIQTRQWEGQDGQKRYTTELIANTVTSLERREREEGDFPGGDGGSSSSGSRGYETAGRSGGGGRAPAASPTRRDDDQPPPIDDLDDLPF
jgi:single-strand DNA-binding protein